MKRFIAFILCIFFLFLVSCDQDVHGDLSTTQSIEQTTVRKTEQQTDFEQINPEPPKTLLIESFRVLNDFVVAASGTQTQYDDFILKHNILNDVPYSVAQKIALNLCSTPIVELKNNVEQESFGCTYYVDRNELDLIYQVEGINYRFIYEYDKTSFFEPEDEPFLENVPLGSVTIGKMYQREYNWTSGYTMLGTVPVFVMVRSHHAEDVQFEDFDFTTFSAASPSYDTRLTVAEKDWDSFAIKMQDGDAVFDSSAFVTNGITEMPIEVENYQISAIEYVEYPSYVGVNDFDWELSIFWNKNTQLHADSSEIKYYLFYCAKGVDAFETVNYRLVDSENDIYEKELYDGRRAYVCMFGDKMYMRTVVSKDSRDFEEAVLPKLMEHARTVKDSLSSENNQNDVETAPNEQITSNPNSNDKTATEEPLPSQSIEIESLEKLNEMREMVTCDDEMRLAQYIQSISDSGVQGKDDLFAFVKMIDSLPQIPILDGNITWICFSHSISEDTGKETNVVYVTTEAGNGNWTRVEYVLSVADISQKILDEKASIGEGSILNSPVKNSDGNLTLHVETRNPHPSGNGTMIQWIGEVDGIFTRIYYFTNAPGEVETESLFRNIQIFEASK